MHIVKYSGCKVQGLSALSCAKMAESIKMQFRMLSRVDPGTCITWGVGRDTFGVSCQLKTIVKQRILEVG